MDYKECPDCGVAPDDKGRCPCSPFTAEDIAFLRAMKGAVFTDESVVVLPSGITITGQGMRFLLSVVNAQ